MPFLSIEDLSCRWPNGAWGVHDLSLQVEAGQCVLLLGRSGSGKSTFLRLLAGLEKCQSGQIFLDRRRIDFLPPAERGLAFLPQQAVLYPQLSVEQNLQSAQPISQANYLPTAMQIEELLRIGHLRNHYPHQLSGGETQRVALARLLRRGCPLWLLDEPFTGFDPAFRSEFRQDLHLLRQQFGITIILVSHDPTDAVTLADHVGVIDHGVLQQLDKVASLRYYPNNVCVAQALGAWNLLNGQLVRATCLRGDSPEPNPRFIPEDQSFCLELPRWFGNLDQTIKQLTLGIRPEELVLHPADPESNGSVLQATTGWQLVFAEPVGSGWFLHLNLGQHWLRMEWRSGTPPPVGACLPWQTSTKHLLVFDGNTGQRIPVSEPL